MRLVPQRTGGDCGIAALATYLEMSYEDVYTAAASIDKARRGKSGMETRRLLALAKQLGVTLRRQKNPDLDVHEGLLFVKWSRRQHGFWWHTVVLYHGIIADPADGYVLDADEYLLRFKCKSGDLLETIK